MASANAPSKIRTCGLLLRRESLYPAELLNWPGAATRYRDDWLPAADWVELDGIGHCPQLDVPLETAQLILGFSGD